MHKHLLLNLEYLRKVIPKDVVDDILAAAIVEEVVGDFVQLKKRGSNYLGLCPFHNEKTPSFNVSPVRNIYKCFGCGRSGNSVGFLMDHEHLTYPDALRYLARKYNIAVPEEREPNENERQQLNERESVYLVLEFAGKYFREQLIGPEEEKKLAQAYITERGISETSSEDFSLGFSPNGWSNFSEAAIKAGFTETYLTLSGMSIKSEKGNLIDRFRGRIMFPIHSVSGRILGFGGRILSNKDKKEAKYINSPESPVYSKSDVLYGLLQAKKAIKEHDICLLVEGYTDVIALHQKGVQNVVSSSGTSLTEGQLKLIKRYSQNICFLFDGDSAGVKASLRAIDLALEEGFNVHAVRLPEGEDPDSFAKKHSAFEVQDFIKTEQKDFILFKTELLLPDAENDPIKKTDVITSVIASIALIPNQLKRSLYVQQCARLLALEEKVLLHELNKRLAESQKNKRKANQATEPDAATETANLDDEETEQTTAETKPGAIDPHELGLLQFLLRFGELKLENNESVAQNIFNFLTESQAFPDNSLVLKIIADYKFQLENFGVVDTKGFYNHEDEEIRKLTIDLSMEKYQSSENWIKKTGLSITPDFEFSGVYQRIILRYKFALITRLVDEAKESLKNAVSEEESDISLEVLSELYKERKAVADQLGIVVNR